MTEIFSSAIFILGCGAFGLFALVLLELALEKLLIPAIRWSRSFYIIEIKSRGSNRTEKIKAWDWAKSEFAFILHVGSLGIYCSPRRWLPDEITMCSGDKWRRIFYVWVWRTKRAKAADKSGPQP